MSECGDRERGYVCGVVKWGALPIGVLLLVFGTVYWIVSHMGEGGSAGTALSIAQVVALPFLLIWVSMWRIVGTTVPRWVFAIALVGMAGGLGLFYGGSTTNQAVLVSQFADDPYDAESRLFREQVRDQIQRYPGSVVARHYAPVRNLRDAARLLRRTPSLRGVVFGDTEWTSIAFPSYPNLSLGDLVPRKSKWAMSPRTAFFPVVQSVPVLGMSTTPKNETAAFIAALYAGLPRGQISPAELTAGNREQLLPRLRDSQQIVAFWSSFAHRAYPLWYEGTLLLLQSLAGSEPEVGTLRCALNRFQEALEFVPSGDNPELRAAILVNQAAVMLLIREALGSALLPPKERKTVQQLYRLAVQEGRLARRWNESLHAPKLAKIALMALSGTEPLALRSGKRSEKPKRKKSKGKRRRNER